MKKVLISLLIFTILIVIQVKAFPESTLDLYFSADYNLYTNGFSTEWQPQIYNQTGYLRDAMNDSKGIGFGGGLNFNLFKFLTLYGSFHQFTSDSVNGAIEMNIPSLISPTSRNVNIDISREFISSELQVGIKLNFVSFDTFKTYLIGGVVMSNASINLIENIEWTEDFTNNQVNIANYQFTEVKENSIGFLFGIGLQHRIFKPLNLSYTIIYCNSGKKDFLEYNLDEYKMDNIRMSIGLSVETF